MHNRCVVRREQKENRCRAHHRAAVFGDKACWRGASLYHHPPLQSHQLPSYGWTCWMTSQNPAEEIRQSKTGSQLRAGPFPAQSYEKSISPWVYLILSKRGMAHLLAQLRQSHACLDHRSLVYHYQSRIFKWAKNKKIKLTSPFDWKIPMLIFYKCPQSKFFYVCPPPPTFVVVSLSFGGQA